MESSIRDANRGRTKTPITATPLVDMDRVLVGTRLKLRRRHINPPVNKVHLNMVHRVGSTTHQILGARIRAIPPHRPTVKVVRGLRTDKPGKAILPRKEGMGNQTLRFPAHRRPSMADQGLQLQLMVNPIRPIPRTPQIKDMVRTQDRVVNSSTTLLPLLSPLPRTRVSRADSIHTARNMVLLLPVNTLPLRAPDIQDSKIMEVRPGRRHTDSSSSSSSSHRLRKVGMDSKVVTEEEEAAQAVHLLPVGDEFKFARN